MSEPPSPRGSASPLPPYRYLPGLGPHPRTHPQGHSYGAPEPRCERLDPSEFATSALYLRGVDLWNHGYWWESHEAFEALWREALPGAEADYFQGLIQLAASEIKRLVGREGAARALAERAIGRLAGVPSPFFGVDVGAFVREAEARRIARAEPPRIVIASLPLP